jgi:serum/glucocorticoid-regulated kinase 2
VNISPQLKSLLLSLLDKNPNARLGAEAGIREILSHDWFGNISMKKLINKELEPPLKPDLLNFNFDEK